MYLIKSDYDLKLSNETYIKKNILAKQKILKRKTGTYFLKTQKVR